ncbi:MAG: hypothetical protein JSS86_02965 [Cyanobacteria bacterium SZAS LIN-2]|nr:hypothetical protein [Cyanobacteria bacterium SZAS LIN-2]
MAVARSLRLMCSVLALGQLLLFASPVMAQQANYWGDYRMFPNTRGYTAYPWSGITPHTTGPQYGYSAWRGSPRGTGAGTTIGMCMLGGIVGLGALSMGSQMLARRGMNKKHNNPNPPKDRIASQDRRKKQELKIKGELDQDYQKELSEKGLAMAPNGANPLGMGAQGMHPMGQGMPQGMSQGMPQGSPAGMQGFPGAQGLTAPAGMAPGQSMGQPSYAAASTQMPAMQGRENVEGDILNPLPWTPGGDP